MLVREGVRGFGLDDLGQTPERHPLRPAAVVSAIVRTERGAPMAGVLINVLNAETGALIDTLPTDDQGYVTFGLSLPGMPVIVKANPPKGYQFSPPQHPWPPGKTLLLKALSPDDPDDKKRWDINKHTVPFSREREKVAAGLSISDPWVIGGIVVGGIVLLSYMRKE